MKKLLRILSLALVLCLLCASGLAETLAQLESDYPKLWEAVQGYLDDYRTQLEEELPDSPAVVEALMNNVLFVDPVEPTCSQPGSVTIDYQKTEEYGVDKEAAYVEVPATEEHEIVEKWLSTYNGEWYDAVEDFENEEWRCGGAFVPIAYCESEDCDYYEEFWDEAIYYDHAPADEWYCRAFFDEDWNDDNEIDWEDRQALANDHYVVWFCPHCGNVMNEYWEDGNGHWFNWLHRFIIKGGVRIYEEDWDEDSECLNEVWAVYTCGDCGLESDKEPVKVYPVRGHNWAVDHYDVYDANGNYQWSWDGSIDLKVALCELTKGWKVKARNYCLNCWNWKTTDAGVGLGGHTPVTGDPNEAAWWATVVQQPTCRDEGYAIAHCKICGAVYTSWGNPVGPTYRLPTTPHDFSIKMYNADYKPTCQNGLTLQYTLMCKNCFDRGENYYEGGLTYPDFKKYGHFEQVTPVELVNMVYSDNVWRYSTTGDLTLIPAAWEIRIDIDGKPTYDADGHFYLPTVAIQRKYECQPAQSQLYNCIFCGKEKLVIHETADMQDRPLWKISKATYTDCTTVSLSGVCTICKGEYHGKIATDYPELTGVAFTLKDDDPRAHYTLTGKDKWDQVIEAFVAPTCLTAGQSTWKCDYCGKTITKVEPATGHAWGPYVLITESDENWSYWMSRRPDVNSRVFVSTCSVCNEQRAYFAKPGESFIPGATAATYYYKKDATIEGNCRVPATVVYKQYKVDPVTGKESATGATLEVKGAYGKHIMAHRTDLDVAATCTTDGVEYWVCTVCGSYDTVKKEFKGHYEKIVTPAAHTWGEWEVTKAATTEAAGEETRVCSVCAAKETREIAQVVAEAAYKLTDIKFAGTVLTGKIVHVEGTKVVEKLSIRVTFFTAGNHYMTTSAVIYPDGTFEAEGAGDIEAITLVAYATDKVVNPADVADLTKLDAAEIVVK